VFCCAGCAYMLAQVVGSVFGSLLIVSVSGCQPLYISVCTCAFRTVLEPFHACFATCCYTHIGGSVCAFESLERLRKCPLPTTLQQSSCCSQQKQIAQLCWYCMVGWPDPRVLHWHGQQGYRLLFPISRDD